MNPDRPPLFEISALRRLQYRWVRTPRLDLVLAGLGVVVWLLLGWTGVVPLALTDVQVDARRAVFQIAAALSGTMAGFTLTSVSVLINLLRTPIGTLDRLLPPEDKRNVGKVVLAVLPNLALTLAVSLLALLLESGPTTSYWWLEAALVLGVGASTLSLARVVWVLRRLLALST